MIKSSKIAIIICFLFSFGLDSLICQSVSATPEFQVKSNTQNISIHGIIQDFADYSILLKYVKNHISNKEESFEMPVLQDGSFGIDFHLSKPTVVTVSYAEQSFELYLEPGDDMALSFNASNILQTIKIEGRGAEHNNFLIADHKKFDQMDRNFILYEMSILSPTAFKTFIEHFQKEKTNFYNSYEPSEQRKFSVGFKQYVANENLYWNALQLLNYRIEKPLLTGGPVPMELPKAYYSFLEDIELCNSNALPNKSYAEFLEEYLKYKSEQKDIGQINFQQIALEIGKTFILEEDGSNILIPLGSTINILKEKKQISTAFKNEVDRYSRLSDWLYIGLPDGTKGWITSQGLEKSNPGIDQDKKVERYAIARYHNLFLLKDPTEDEVVGRLGLGEELTYFHLKTSENHLYTFNGTPYWDLLCKVKTKSGIEGWVSESTLEFRERVVHGNQKDEGYVYSLTDTSDSRKYLEGEVLFYTLAKALFWKMQLEDISKIGRELAAFKAINPYPEFNKILKGEFDVAQLKNKGNGAYVENYAFSNVSNANIVGVVKQLPFEDKKVYASRSLRAKKVASKKYVDIPCSPANGSKTKMKLSGKVSNASNKTLTITVLHETISYKEEILKINPDASGNFALIIDLEKPAIATLQSNEAYETFYIKPGDELVVNFDANKLHSSLFFGGKDDVLNNMLMHLHQTFEEDITLLNSKKDSYSFNEYKNKYTDLWKKQSSYFNKLAKKTALQVNDKDFIEAEIDFSYAVNLMYALINKQMDPETENFDRVNYKFLNQLQISRQDVIANQNYVEFLHTYFEYLKKLPENKNSTISDLAEIYLTGEPLNYIWAKELAKQCKLGKAYEAGKPIKRYLEGSEDEQFNQILRVVYNETKELNEGALAPDFTLADINGNVVSLSDYQGKVVFIDFWATWCRPCIKMMHYGQELQSFYDSKNVVFLFVSMDEDKNAWQSYVNNNNLTGTHLNVNNGDGYLSDIAKLYKVRKLPFTMLIDQEGRVAYNPSASPSSNRIFSQINALLANPKF